MLSIIIPTFNEELFLPHLLRSLKEQTFNNFEIIVADNNSTDATRSITLRAGAKKWLMAVYQLLDATMAQRLLRVNGCFF